MAALKQMRLGGRKEKKGAARQMLMRSRREGDPVPSILAPEDDNRGYIETEYDGSGNLVTDPDTIPRP